MMKLKKSFSFRGEGGQSSNNNIAAVSKIESSVAAIMDALEAGSIRSIVQTPSPGSPPTATTTSNSEGGGGRNNINLDQSESTNCVRELTKDELQAMRYGSKIVYTVLITVGIALSAATYVFLSMSRQKEFVSAFHSYSREVSDIAENNAENTFQQLRTLATSITSHGTDSYSFENEKGFPNITIPHFEVRAKEIVEAAGVEMVMFVPFVESTDQYGWEDYINNQLVNHINYHDTHPGISHIESSDDDSSDNSTVTTMDHDDNHDDGSMMADDHDHNGQQHDVVHHGGDHDDHERLPNTPIYHKIIACDTCTDIQDTRDGFVDEDFFMEELLEQYGGFNNTLGLKAPIAQYGPISQDLEYNINPLIMQDLFSHPVFKKEMVASIEYNVPVISETIDLEFLLKHSNAREKFNHDLHMEHMNSMMMDRSNDDDHNHHHAPQIMHHDNKLRSFTLDAVKESFAENARTMGFVVGIVPWNIFFENLLTTDRHHHSQLDENSKGLNGLVATMVSDCGSTFTYVMNGDHVDEAYDGDMYHLYKGYEHITHSVQFFWKEHPKGQSRHCHFDLHLYPSEEFYSRYHNNDPIIYAIMVILVFTFTGILFNVYDRYVFNGQKQVITQATSMVVNNARKAAKNERELNDFIAHEVRNPLAAAMSACSFVSTAIVEDSSTNNNGNGQQLVKDDELRKSVQDDIQIIDSSLHFINDLLRNMLDMQRANSNQMTIENKPTLIMDDIFKPIGNMLHVRDVGNVQVLLECTPPDLAVMTDPLRLKQILLNLSRNSVKFVEHGFIRLRAELVSIEGNDDSSNNNPNIVLSVEDSGPGIPEEKRKQLFSKFQETLDSLNQGTGIGLNLCKKLTDLMGGHLYIDEHYNSGVSRDCPGTRFVFNMNKQPWILNDQSLNELSRNTSHTMRSKSSKKRSLRHMSTSNSTNSSRNLLVVGGDSVSGCEMNASTGSFECDSILLDSVDDDAFSYGDDIDDDQSSCCSLPTELPTDYSVLFVDDDMVLRKLFARTIKKVSPTWRVSEAANGETAIQMMEEGGSNKYDLIFMDQYMASVQKQLLGTETVRAIRSLNGISATIPKICGLSANDVEKAFEDAGANSFMFKPFPCKPEQLKEELLRIVYSDYKEMKKEQMQIQMQIQTANDNDDADVVASNKKDDENNGPKEQTAKPQVAALFDILSKKDGSGKEEEKAKPAAAAPSLFSLIETDKKKVEPSSPQEANPSKKEATTTTTTPSLFSLIEPKKEEEQQQPTEMKTETTPPSLFSLIETSKEATPSSLFSLIEPKKENEEQQQQIESMNSKEGGPQPSLFSLLDTKKTTAKPLFDLLEPLNKKKEGLDGKDNNNGSTELTIGSSSEEETSPIGHITSLFDVDNSKGCRGQLSSPPSCKGGTTRDSSSSLFDLDPSLSTSKRSIRLDMTGRCIVE